MTKNKLIIFIISFSLGIVFNFVYAQNFGSNFGPASAALGSIGGFRCDQSNGVKDCFNEVWLGNQNDYQLYKGIVTTGVDQSFQSNANVKVETCFYQFNTGSTTGNFSSGNVNGCATPINNTTAGPTVFNGGNEIDLGYLLDLNVMTIHIRVDHLYSNTNATAFGRRVFINKLDVLATANVGQPFAVFWGVDNSPWNSEFFAFGNISCINVNATTTGGSAVCRGTAPGTPTVEVRAYGPAGSGNAPWWVVRNTTVNIVGTPTPTPIPTFYRWNGGCGCQKVVDPNTECGANPPNSYCGLQSNCSDILACVPGGTPTPTPTPSVTPTLTPRPDTTPPIISNVKIINITATSATVTWDTNEISDSQVEYCKTGSRCGINTVLSSQLVTSHSVNLAGLLANTSYYIWAKSKDGAGNSVTLGYFLFRTLSQVSTPTPTPTSSLTPTPTPTSTGTPTPTTTPSPTPVLNPVVVSNVKVSSITRDSVVVAWDTDRPADSKIYSCALGLFCFATLFSDANFITAHDFTISGLKADRNYYIKIEATDSNGQRGTSSTIVLKTLPGLTISNVMITKMSQSSVNVVWDTDYPANSGIKVCSIYFFCFFSAPIRDLTLATAHSMTVSNLKSGTTYYYQVTSVDPSGYQAKSSLSSFKTP